MSEAIIDWLGMQQDAMIALLRKIVNIDSGSYNKPGIDAVGDVLRAFLTEHGVAIEAIPQQRHGDCLRAIVPWDGPTGNAGGNILLMGHRDTVFPDGEVERRPFTIRDGVAYGPGVADMKAGLVMNCFLLAAFAKFGAPAPIAGLFTGDEEIGSPEGRPVIENEARHARVVFNSEPGRISGNVVTGRKGGVFMSMRIEGKAAHSGGNFTDGISAIEELARKIQALHALTDLDRGITLNVGLVRGGQSVNTVAPWAEGDIDLRFVRSEDRDDAMAHIAAIVERSLVPGTRASLTVRGEFLPLEQSAPIRSGCSRCISVPPRRVDSTPAGSSPAAAPIRGLRPESAHQRSVPSDRLAGRRTRPRSSCASSSLVPRAQACARAILKVAEGGV